MGNFNDIIFHRNEVRNNILKSFDSEFDELEKGKWNVGDQRFYHGTMHYVAELKPDGSPRWRRVKKGSGGDNSSDTSSTSSQNNKPTSSVDKNSSSKKVNSDKKTRENLPNNTITSTKDSNNTKSIDDKKSSSESKEEKGWKKYSSFNEMWDSNKNMIDKEISKISEDKNKYDEKTLKKFVGSVLKKLGIGDSSDVYVHSGKNWRGDIIRLEFIKDSDKGWFLIKGSGDKGDFKERLNESLHEISSGVFKYYRKKEKVSKLKKISSSSLSNDFDKVVNLISKLNAEKTPVYDKQNGGYNFENNPVKYLPASKWKNNVMRVGSDWTGKDDLVIFEGESMPDYDIQVRKIISYGRHTEGSVGDVIVELGGGHNYNMSKDSDRKKFAIDINKMIDEMYDEYDIKH